MEIELADHFDRMNSVVEELLKGSTPTQIATTTGLKRSEVLEYIDEWKQVVRSDSSARDKAKEAISAADQHYAMLIREAHDLAKEAKMQGQLNVQGTALKLALDIQTKKVSMLQDVGLLENNELASQISDTERKQEILVKILKEVSASCPKCKIEVSKRLSQLNNVAEPIEIVEQVPNE
jgi:hypothetical protein